MQIKDTMEKIQGLLANNINDIIPFLRRPNIDEVEINMCGQILLAEYLKHQGERFSGRVLDIILSRERFSDRVLGVLLSDEENGKSILSRGELAFLKNIYGENSGNAIFLLNEIFGQENIGPLKKRYPD